MFNAIKIDGYSIRPNKFFSTFSESELSRTPATMPCWEVFEP